eukprot:scaffold1973_cov101-Isochrysis_galbana.AAC.1
MRILRSARPPGTCGAAGRWPPAGTRRRWPGQGLPAQASRAGPRVARPRCDRGAERWAVWTAQTARPTWPATGGRVSGTGEGGGGGGEAERGSETAGGSLLPSPCVRMLPHRLVWKKFVCLCLCLSGYNKNLKENSPQGTGLHRVCTGRGAGAGGALTLWTLQSVAQPSKLTRVLAPGTSGRWSGGKV